MPYLYVDLLNVVNDELKASGVSEGKARELAERISEKFCSLHGDRVYRVPIMKSLLKTRRDAEIRRDAEVMRPGEIAEKHGLSVRFVQKIINNPESPDA